MDQHDLPRSFGRRTAGVANARAAAQRLIADATALDGGAIDRAKYLLELRPATLAKACGITTADLQALLCEAREQYHTAEHARPVRASVSMIRRRVEFRVALALAKEIVVNTGS